MEPMNLMNITIEKIFNLPDNDVEEVLAFMVELDSKANLDKIKVKDVRTDLKRKCI